MTTVTMLDLRRTDQRANVLSVPYWLTSAEITKDADDLAAVLFSFPDAGKIYYIHQLIVNVTTAFTGDGTEVLLVGLGTLATDAVTTAGLVTDVDQSEFYASGTVTEGTAMPQLPAVAANYGAAWKANIASDGTANAEMFIHGAATTVPVIAAYLSSDAAITGGVARVNILISELPAR